LSTPTHSLLIGLNRTLPTFLALASTICEQERSGKGSKNNYRRLFNSATKNEILGEL
jgi:hypothetical protein